MAVRCVGFGNLESNVNVHSSSVIRARVAFLVIHMDFWLDLQ